MVARVRPGEHGLFLGLELVGSHRLDELVDGSGSLWLGEHVNADGGRRSEQPTAAVREAYWYGTRLLHHGWIIRCIGATERGGYFVAETPGGRAVTVGSGARRGVHVDIAEQFADSITALARQSRFDRHNHVRDLLMLISAQPVPRRPAQLRWRTWHIPGLSAAQQPPARVRAAYWFAATLTDDYRWALFDVGSPSARGGFVADVPGEVIAIYPAGMLDDGTTASALARLLAALSGAEIRTLVSLLEWHRGTRRCGRDARH